MCRSCFSAKKVISYQIRLVEFTIIHRVTIDNKQLLSVPRSLFPALISILLKRDLVSKATS